MKYSTTAAIKAFWQQTQESYKAKVTIDDVAYTLSYKMKVGSGGSKLIYAIDDGDVIAMCQSSKIGIWERLVSEEIHVSKMLADAGLLTQRCRESTVVIDGNAMKTLRMKNFQTLSKQGIQVRDEDCQFGDTQLFGTVENLQNETHLRSLFMSLKEDIIILIKHGIQLSMDTYHLTSIMDKEFACDCS